MRRAYLILGILAALLITSLTAACGPTVGAGEVPRISAEELNRRLDGGEDILVIDSRNSGRQYELSHIRGAIRNPGSFGDVDKEQAIVAYCTSEGEVNSATLASGLYAQGFTNVSVLDGGLSAWTEAEYPTEGSGSSD